MTCAHCSELQEELTELRRQLAIEVDRDKVAVLGCAFRITGQQATIVAVLYDAKGRPIQKGLLLDMLPVVFGEREDTKIIDVQIHRIRKALGHEFIETFRATGYQLSDQARARCEAVLAQKVAA